MQTEFKIPDLGENIEGGDVVGVLVNKGDTIKEDQPVIELETDKAVVELTFFCKRSDRRCAYLRRRLSDHRPISYQP